MSEVPPALTQPAPGVASDIAPEPEYLPSVEPARRLNGKVAIVTGGDSGIGRAVAVAFAAEGAKLVIVYLESHADAAETQAKVEAHGSPCVLLPLEIAIEASAAQVVETTMREFGRIDILVNNAGEQHPQASIADIDSAQLERTFRTNVFSMFHLTKAVLPHLDSGARIINTASVTAYRGSPRLLDYSATKGAIVAFTRSLALQLADRHIHVNAVAPGPVWTPLVTSTFDEQDLQQFGKNTPLGRPGQPEEIAPSYVFLASSDASYMTGQVLHPNGGDVVNA
ncbi:SDR family oxidoreductase [soil metagenome]